MKRKYDKPSISIDVFEANEYIATCAIAVCDISINTCGTNGIYYIDKNGKDGYQDKKGKGKGDQVLPNHNACGTEIKKSFNNLQPFHYDSDGEGPKGGKIQGYYWKKGNKYHLTTGYRTTGSSTC